MTGHIKWNTCIVVCAGTTCFWRKKPVRSEAAACCLGSLQKLINQNYRIVFEGEDFIDYMVY